jgi:hypothetical protein
MMHKVTENTVGHEVERRLDDMGLNGERPHSPELRAAARAYCLELVREETENTTQALLSEVVDSAEGMTLGFVEGYEACLKAHKIPSGESI